MAYVNRQKKIEQLFPKQPTFRLRQIEEALFQPELQGWRDITTIPKTMRETLEAETPFLSVTVKTIQSDKDEDTFKAVLDVEGGKQIETVLIKNSRDYWTICLSTQVGCAMACSFCATGKMGLTRNLDSEEIIDQYRMWQQFLAKRPELAQTISNIVYMGMGEPMSNYENVKASLNTILAHTEIGKTRITVSTVGILPRLEQLLDDPDWPHVRLAISLHSANAETRKKIIPSSYEDFLPKLADWSHKYLEKFGNRRHHLTFEYIMLRDVNDSQEDAEKLSQYVKSIGNVRVNLIPYNITDSNFATSADEHIAKFQDILHNSGVTVTTRKSKGTDITAACGQLVKDKIKNRLVSVKLPKDPDVM